MQGLLVLGFGDPAAGYVGRRWGWTPVPGAGKKTFEVYDMFRCLQIISLVPCRIGRPLYGTLPWEFELLTAWWLCIVTTGGSCLSPFWFYCLFHRPNLDFREHTPC